MKEITGEHQRIDDVLRRVDSLVVPIEELDFDPFSMCKKENWNKVIQEFQSKVQVRSRISLHVKGFICIVSDHFTLLRLC